MSDALIGSEQCLEYARSLVAHLEAGDEPAAQDALDALSAMRESQLFQELGKLTRELHDTLANFQIDSKMTDLAQTDIPDAKERLNHVITMTEQAADKTLCAVEELQPMSDELQERLSKLRADWGRFRNRNMPVEEFREFSRELEQFFDWTEQMMPQFNGKLTDIMMAQDFQDLTGQIIRRVITLVQDVEGGLVDLIRISGQKLKPQAEKKEVNPIEATGPSIEGIDTEDIVTGQDDVDDLLSSLGF